MDSFCELVFGEINSNFRMFYFFYAMYLKYVISWRVDFILLGTEMGFLLKSNCYFSLFLSKITLITISN